MLRSGVRRRVLLMSYMSLASAAALFAFFQLQIVIQNSNNSMAMAFRPAALRLVVRRGTNIRSTAVTTRLQFSSSSGGLGLDIKPPLPTAGGRQGELRRRKAKPNSNSLAKLASQLPGYQEGTLILHSTTANDTENMMVDSKSATINGSAGEREDKEYYQKLFPNIGKNVLELPPRMRFAPSPTGSLHVGGARTALYNWLVAKKGQLEHYSSPTSEAAFVLRVEDTDVARSTRESEESVLADLSWLGLTWDEGPDMPLGKYGPYRQSEREYIYKQIANRLIDEGKAYPCFCTTEELDVMKANMEALGIPPRYDGTWRDANPDLVAEKMAANVPYTVRFKVPPGARVVIDDAVRGTVSWDAEATVGDFILLRSSGIPVYNFCVAVDDAAMGITTVIRAEEHLTNTLRQGLILDALGVPRPRYAHCSLILGDDRQKLSKRHGATSCNQFRLDGFLPDAMINYLALLGWNDGTDNEIYTRDELIDIFDVDRINASPSVFDMDKLKWVNSQHLKRMAVEDMLHLVEEQLLALNVMTSSSDVDDKLRREFVFACTTLAKQMMETTQDAATNAISVLGYDLPSTFNDLPEGSEARMMVVRGNFYTIAMRLVEMYNANNFPMPRNNDLLAAFVDVASGTPIIEDTQLGGDVGSYPQEYKTSMKAMAKEMNIKGKELFHPIRLALTGSMSGQDVTKQLSLLAMAEQDGTVVNIDSVGLVPFNVRMERLRAFCDTIPMEYRMTEEQATTDKANNASTKNEVSSMTKDGLTNNGGEKSNMDKSGTRSMSSSSLSSTTDPLDTYDGPPITALDIRVGRITKVWAHEESEKLFCEEIDVGEAEPRLIASGLRPYMSAENLDGRLVLVLCNLKERKLAGFPSHGMVLCASNEDHTEVKVVSVPVEAKVGERVTIPGVDFELESAAPFAENKIGKQKVFEKIAPFLRTGEYGVPEFCGRPLMTSAGVCTSSITNGSVS